MASNYQFTLFGVLATIASLFIGLVLEPTLNFFQRKLLSCIDNIVLVKNQDNLKGNFKNVKLGSHVFLKNKRNNFVMLDNYNKWEYINEWMNNKYVQCHASSTKIKLLNSKTFYLSEIMSLVIMFLDANKYFELNMLLLFLVYMLLIFLIFVVNIILINNHLKLKTAHIDKNVIFNQAKPCDNLRKKYYCLSEVSFITEIIPEELKDCFETPNLGEFGIKLDNITNKFNSIKNNTLLEVEGSLLDLDKNLKELGTLKGFDSDVNFCLESLRSDVTPKRKIKRSRLVDKLRFCGFYEEESPDLYNKIKSQSNPDNIDQELLSELMSNVTFNKMGYLNFFKKNLFHDDTKVLVSIKHANNPIEKMMTAKLKELSNKVILEYRPTIRINSLNNEFCHYTDEIITNDSSKLLQLNKEIYDKKFPESKKSNYRIVVGFMRKFVDDIFELTELQSSPFKSNKMFLFCSSIVGVTHFQMKDYASVINKMVELLDTKNCYIKENNFPNSKWKTFCVALNKFCKQKSKKGKDLYCLPRSNCDVGRIYDLFVLAESKYNEKINDLLKNRTAKKGKMEEVMINNDIIIVNKNKNFLKFKIAQMEINENSQKIHDAYTSRIHTLLLQIKPSPIRIKMSVTEPKNNKERKSRSFRPVTIKPEITTCNQSMNYFNNMVTAMPRDDINNIKLPCITDLSNEDEMKSIRNFYYNHNIIGFNCVIKLNKYKNNFENNYTKSRCKKYNKKSFSTKLKTYLAKQKFYWEITKRGLYFKNSTMLNIRSEMLNDYKHTEYYSVFTSMFIKLMKHQEILNGLLENHFKNEFNL